MLNFLIRQDLPRRVLLCVLASTMSMVVSVSTGLGQGAGLEGLGQFLSPELLGQIQRSQGAGGVIETPSPLDAARHEALLVAQRAAKERSLLSGVETGGQADMGPFLLPEERVCR